MKYKFTDDHLRHCGHFVFPRFPSYKRGFLLGGLFHQRRAQYRPCPGSERVFLLRLPNTEEGQVMNTAATAKLPFNDDSAGCPTVGHSQDWRRWIPCPGEVS